MIYDKAVKKKPHTRLVAYRDVQTDNEGWANVADYLPGECDLVNLKIEGKKPICGWISGNMWMGLRLRKKDKILYWKKDKEELSEK